jgi:hypothetical protein
MLHDIFPYFVAKICPLDSYAYSQGFDQYAPDLAILLASLGG